VKRPAEKCGKEARTSATSTRRFIKGHQLSGSFKGRNVVTRPGGTASWEGSFGKVMRGGGGGGGGFGELQRIKDVTFPRNVILVS